MNLLLLIRILAAGVEARAGRWVQTFAPAPEPLSFLAAPDALLLVAPLTCYYYDYGGQ